MAQSHVSPCSMDLLEQHSSGKLDDDSLLLSSDHAQQINQFRQELRLCKGDTEKYEVCAQTQDEVLRHYTGLQLLIAAYEHVMLVECTKYKEWKDNQR